MKGETYLFPRTFDELVLNDLDEVNTVNQGKVIIYKKLDHLPRYYAFDEDGFIITVHQQHILK